MITIIKMDRSCSVDRSKVAIDAEKVGVGPGGKRDMVARVSLVNEQGYILYDRFVAPTERVMCYRTQKSGVRRSDLIGAESIFDVRKEVKRIITNKILIGHEARQDLNVLGITHPEKDIRDTAYYPKFKKYQGRSGRPPLRILARELLGTEIQQGEHSSVEDARATMKIYQKVALEWERSLLLSASDSDAVDSDASKSDGSDLNASDLDVPD